MPKNKSRKRRSSRRGKTRTATTRFVKPLPRISGSLPSAYARQVKAKFYVRHSRTGVRCGGVDLIQPLPDAVEYNNALFVFTALPCSPVYWEGTRIAAMAAAYQNYRPIKFRVHYVPQVAVTTPGTVIVGTIWNTPTSTSSFQQTLVTSNGGLMSQCYVPFTSNVRLGTNLTQNLYRCAGDMGPECNPFFFLALMKGTNVIPGYFFVEYEYELKNPLGQSVTYTVERTTYPDTGLPSNNKSLITLGPIPGYSGPGLVLDVESNGSTYYHGSEISVPNGTHIVVYSNSPFEVSTTQVGGVGSIVVTYREAVPGETWDRFTSRVHDFARYNAANDVNLQEGYFEHGGQLGFGFERIADGAKEFLAFWTENVMQEVSKLLIYSFDFGLNVIGELIGVIVPTATTMLKPLLTIKLFTDDGYDYKRRPRSELRQLTTLWVPPEPAATKKTKKTRLVSLEESSDSS